MGRKCETQGARFKGVVERPGNVITKGGVGGGALQMYSRGERWGGGMVWDSTRGGAWG